MQQNRKKLYMQQKKPKDKTFNIFKQPGRWLLE